MASLQADQNASNERVLQILKTRSTDKDDQSACTECIKVLVKRLRYRLESGVLSTLLKQDAISVLTSTIMDDRDDEFCDFLDAQCTMGPQKGITTVRIMAGFVLSQVSKLRSALDRFLDSPVAYECMGSKPAKGGGSSGCLEQILAWLRPNLASWQSALLDKAARAAITTALVPSDPCAASYEPFINAKLPKKKPTAVLGALLTMHVLNAVVRAGTEDTKSALYYLQQPAHRYGRKIASGKFPPWYLRLYLHGIRAGGVANLNPTDPALAPWHVHIEDLALICIKSIGSSAKLGARLFNRGLQDMTGDHSIGAQGILIAFRRTTIHLTVLALEEVYSQKVMAAALQESGARVAAKRAESVVLKERGNELVADQQWKAALDVYNQAAQADADNYAAIGNASLCAFRLKKYWQGANLAVHALLVKPTWAKAWVRLAQCAEHLKFSSHLEDFPVACVRMAIHLQPASRTEYLAALSVERPECRYNATSSAPSSFRWMYIAQKAANVGYSYDPQANVSQLAHHFAVTNAHNKVVVQKALREDSSLKAHLKSCGLDAQKAKGDVWLTNQIYTTLMRTAPTFTDHILQYEPRNLALVGRVGEVVDFMEQDALAQGTQHFTQGSLVGQRLNATQKAHEVAVITWSLVAPDGNFSIGEDAPFPSKKPHDCFLLSCAKGTPLAATECEIGFPTWTMMKRLLLSAAFGTRRGWVHSDRPDVFTGQGLPLRIMFAHRLGYMFNEAAAWCQRVGISTVYETRFAARDASLGHGTHVDGFNDTNDEGSLTMPSGYSPGYKKYKWLLTSDRNNVPIAASMGFTESEKEAEGKFAAWHETQVRNKNREHGNMLD